jgi:tetratricopeptide (TPR) repeat protein
MDQALALVIASMVNLHHFILDGAIWKLRGRIAEILIRSRREEPQYAAPGSRGAWGRVLVWTALAGLLALHLFNNLNKELVLSDGRNSERISAAEERLRPFGLDHAGVRLQLGQNAIRRGDTAEARAQLERTLALGHRKPTVDILARTYATAGDWQAVAELYERAATEEPGQPTFQRETGYALIKLGRGREALPWLEGAAEQLPEDEVLAQRLAILRERLAEPAER